MKVGTVLKLFVSDTTPPKEKRFIVVGIHQNNCSLAAVYINSELNPKVNWCLDLKIQHLFFEKQERSYLTRDSYVDCSKLAPKDLAEIKHAVANNPEAIIGEVSVADFELIKTTIIHSKTIKGKDKKRYGFYD